MIMEDLFNNQEEELYEDELVSDLYRPYSPASSSDTILRTDSFTDSVVSAAVSSEHQADEAELIKERFAKLLLAEDMSGSGKGVSTAVAISNAITNLYATVFGHSLRLEPLSHKKKALWRREMDCLLAVCDHMVEILPPPAKVRPRSDICINLPALQKLDSILLEILDSFAEKEFCYVEDGSVSMSSTRSGSFRKVVHRNEDKWWVPVPCVPSGGLSVESRKHLRHKRDGASQVHKAAMAINASILAEMQVPASYLATLPKSGKASVGECIYRYLSSAGEGFSPDDVLDSLCIRSEHEALELADQEEASMHTWKRKAGDKNRAMADRAEHLLFLLKQRYPQLSQTSLDTCKIQDNKDLGQAILESYSRVVEGLAFNIASWIEDVLYVDANSSNIRNEQL